MRAGRWPARNQGRGRCPADGISSSEAGQLASQAAVTSFLEDYYCTSDAWSVKRSAERVLAAANSWLFAQTQQGHGRYDKDRGWACTFSALVIKSRTAHLFHAGDARIYQVQGRTLEQLTTDHRVHVGGGQSYLGRAFGIAPQVEIDYRSVSLAVGDTFVLATDGVHSNVPAEAMVAAINSHGANLDDAALAIADEALRLGSEDNLTVQVVRIEALPDEQASELSRRAADLPLLPVLQPRAELDGYRIVRELHFSSRSHVYLAVDIETQAVVALKAPAPDLEDGGSWRERFLLEEWIARRVDSPHLLKAFPAERPRSALYAVTEYLEGATLTQWMLDHPRPALDTVRDMVEQLGKGLRTLHRAETVHQDLRPHNVMVDSTGTLKIIDFGAACVAGIMETAGAERQPLPGTAQYMAPEYVLGAAGSARSDLFSLAVIAYQMLTGRLPYGMEMPKCRTLQEQKRVRYHPVRESRPDIPAWVDRAIRKALQPEPHQRFADVAEFVYALQRPGSSFEEERSPSLIERDPLRFWQGLTLLLALSWVVMGFWLLGR